MENTLTFKDFYWINEPAESFVDESTVRITTEPETDLWAKTYYGFDFHNAPMLVTAVEACYFTFTVHCAFNYEYAFDQCGIVLYQDAENWLKSSAELEGSSLQLGSVVTNLGYSDWSSREVSQGVRELWYRLSRRDSDFLIEFSFDGQTFSQHRILHMHTVSADGIGSGCGSGSGSASGCECGSGFGYGSGSGSGSGSDSALGSVSGSESKKKATVQIGIYAASPSEGASFRAEFSQMSLGPCLWEL